MKDISSFDTDPHELCPHCDGTGHKRKLTECEIRVLEMLGRGCGTVQIAERLGRSVKTIETHRAHIKEKLGLENATQLTVYATHYANKNISQKAA